MRAGSRTKDASQATVARTRRGARAPTTSERTPASGGRRAGEAHPRRADHGTDDDVQTQARRVHPMEARELRAPRRLQPRRSAGRPRPTADRRRPVLARLRSGRAREGALPERLHHAADGARGRQRPRRPTVRRRSDVARHPAGEPGRHPDHAPRRPPRRRSRTMAGQGRAHRDRHPLEPERHDKPQHAGDRPRVRAHGHQQPAVRIPVPHPALHTDERHPREVDPRRLQRRRQLRSGRRGARPGPGDRQGGGRHRRSRPRRLADGREPARRRAGTLLPPGRRDTGRRDPNPAARRVDRADQGREVQPERSPAQADRD